MSLVPYVVAWCFLAFAVLALAIYRNLAGMHEDDLLHIGPGEERLVAGQVAFFRPLERVDHWGKTLMAITVAGGVILASIALARAWHASSSSLVTEGSHGKMMEFFVWLEQTRFSVWIRESGSIWAYPLVLTMHTCGMGVLVGFNWAVDLRLLGFAPGIPVRSLERFFPVMWVGFWINTATGIVLLIADASTKMTSWVFGVKMIFIVFAMMVLWKIRNGVFRYPGPDPAAVLATRRSLAVLSIALWALSITAGRLMAYLGPVNGLK